MVCSQSGLEPESLGHEGCWHSPSLVTCLEADLKWHVQLESFPPPRCLSLPFSNAAPGVLPTSLHTVVFQTTPDQTPSAPKLYKQMTPWKAHFPDTAICILMRQSPMLSQRSTREAPVAWLWSDHTHSQEAGFAQWLLA